MKLPDYALELAVKLHDLEWPVLPAVKITRPPHIRHMDVSFFLNKNRCVPDNCQSGVTLSTAEEMSVPLSSSEHPHAFAIVVDYPELCNERLNIADLHQRKNKFVYISLQRATVFPSHTDGFISITILCFCCTVNEK